MAETEVELTTELVDVSVGTVVPLSRRRNTGGPPLGCCCDCDGLWRIRGEVTYADEPAWAARGGGNGIVVSLVAESADSSNTAGIFDVRNGS